MLILEAAPQLLVGHVDIGGDLVEELFFGNFGAVVLLELEEQALLPGHRAVEKPLVLGGVELPIGLQIVGGWRADADVLGAGIAFEEAA